MGNIYIENRKRKIEKIREDHPGALICDLTSKSDSDEYRFLSPFYPHYGIPVPGMENETSACLITYGKVSVNFWGHPNWLYASALPLTGMTVMLYLSKHVTVNSKALLYIGANTLVYFALHRQILQLVERLFAKMQQGFSIEASIVTNLLEVLVIALLLVVPTFLINKYIPQVTGKGRKLWK